MISDENLDDELRERDPELYNFLKEYAESQPDNQPIAIQQNSIAALKQNLLSQIVKQRRQQQLTQRELSDVVGLPQSTISRIESGAGNPSLKTLLAIVAALGLQIELRGSR